jgi:hypothetical protein
VLGVHMISFRFGAQLAISMIRASGSIRKICEAPNVVSVLLYGT